jgi:hypothetical protein
LVPFFTVGATPNLPAARKVVMDATMICVREQESDEAQSSLEERAARRSTWVSQDTTASQAGVVRWRAASRRGASQLKGGYSCGSTHGAMIAAAGRNEQARSRERHANTQTHEVGAGANEATISPAHEGLAAGHLQAESQTGSSHHVCCWASGRAPTDGKLKHVC